mmetsp:Transcript_19877/g.36125  ORF Transcript_19877/g.36125 Transcript_19877/m.36125 type:complete len:240 (+) Transcript_19877:481-1200(+)
MTTIFSSGGIIWRVLNLRVLGFFRSNVRPEEKELSARIPASSFPEQPAMTVPSSRVSISTTSPIGSLSFIGESSKNLVTFGGVPVKTTPSLPLGSFTSMASGFLVILVVAGFLSVIIRPSTSTVSLRSLTSSGVESSMYVGPPGIIKVSAASPTMNSVATGDSSAILVIVGGVPEKLTPRRSVGRYTIFSSGRGMIGSWFSSSIQRPVLSSVSPRISWTSFQSRSSYSVPSSRQIVFTI